MTVPVSAPPSSEYLLAVENLEFGYSKTGARLFDGFTAGFEGGAFTAVVGPSGVGKSSLLNLLCGLLVPWSGVVRVDGDSIGDGDQKRWTRLRARTFGFVYQDFRLLPQLTARQNVAITARLRPANGLEPSRALDSVGLAGRAGHYPHQLSGGEQQRVAVARALVGLPRVVLADEPTGALDQENEFMILDLLRSLADRGSAVVVVTHSSTVADFADRVLRLGGVTAEDTETSR